MNEPGAEKSGFTLPSSAGPRLENADIPCVLLAALSLAIGLAGKSAGHNSPQSSAPVPQF